MIDLWKDRSEEMVLKSYLEAKARDERARQDAANERLAIYHDDWDDVLEELLAAQFHAENYKNIKITRNTSQNIVKKVVNEVSILYKDPPVRDTQENEIMDEIYTYLGIDEFMKRVERYGMLLNDVGIRVGWDDDLEKITLDLHTPANTSVIQRDDYPEQAAAVYYPIEYVDDKFKADKQNVYWSDNEHFIFDEKGNASPPPGNEDMKNPYGVLPFVFLHLEPIPSMFWNKTGGSDLISGTKTIGLKRTLKDYLFKWQSFKQMWIKSMNAKDIPSEMLSDPSYAMKFWGEGSEIGVLDLQGDFAQLDETIRADMNAFLGTYGLSVDMFAASPDESSGRALAFKNRGLREIREGHMPFFRNLEAALCEMIRTVYNAYHGEKAIPEIEFSIDYAEMDIYIDPMEKRRQAEWDLQHGLISLAQFYMMFNSDCPDEETAEKMLLDNTGKTKAMEGKGFDLGKYFSNDSEVDVIGDSIGNGSRWKAASLAGVSMPATDKNTAGLKPGAPTEAVADTAMNGAQIASLVDVVMSAATGEIPLTSVMPILVAAFPNIEESILQRIVTSLKGFKPKDNSQPENKQQNKEDVSK